MAVANTAIIRSLRYNQGINQSRYAMKKTLPLYQTFSQFPSDAPLFNSRPLPLGGMTANHFLKHYWHKKPLLIRNAIPCFEAFFQPENVLTALKDENIESRLIVQKEDAWEILNGPVNKKQIPSRKQSNWTALIQSVDLHDAKAHALLGLFRFIPDARLDDLMVSFATDGGGVGAHYDSYDVFLLQAHGQRRWKIGEGQDLTLKPNLPLKILQNFVPTQEFILEPGDMLYLPPHYAHDGVAIGECMTYSIGFRAPSYREISVALLNFVEDNIELEGRYADPKLKLQETPAELPSYMVDDMYEKLKKMRWDKSWVAECLGCYLSEPKSCAWFESVADISLADFKKEAKRLGVELAAGTKMLYHDPWIFINGEHFVADGQDAYYLHDLADERLSDANWSTDLALWTVIYEWFCLGWLRFKL